MGRKVDRYRAHRNKAKMERKRARAAKALDDAVDALLANAREVFATKCKVKA